MVRSNAAYKIEIHYPENEFDMLSLRKRMGNAYGQFLENYILALPISDKEKNRLYASVVGRLASKRDDRL